MATMNFVAVHNDIRAVLKDAQVGGGRYYR